MKKIILIIVIFFAGLTTSYAVPFIPEEKGMTLLTIEQSESSEKLNLLRTQVKIDKNNILAVEAYVAFNILLAREKSDPRYFGYAKAALLEYSKQDPKNISYAALLLHWADIMQFMHNFEEAEKTLLRVLEIPGNNPRASLMLSSIYQSQGRYQEALNQCNSLFSRTSMLVVATCITQIKSLTGHLEDSYALLSGQIRNDQHSDLKDWSWALNILADMAARSGMHSQADKYFRESVKLDPYNQFNLSEYADYLLEQKRFDEAQTLLSGHLENEGLLLRYSIASAQSKIPSTEKNIVKLEKSYALSQRRNKDSHLRDQSIFYLFLKDQPAKAFTLAKTNWQSQKEPADAKILLRCAIKINNIKAINLLQEWKTRTQYEDVEWDNILKTSNTTVPHNNVESS